MPQIKAAKKALRASARRRVINDRWRRQVRESIYKLRDAVKAGDVKAADEAHRTAQKTIDRAARRNIIHPNKAARQKSQLSSLLKSG